MEYKPYFCGQNDWPFKLIYNKYHNKHYSKADEHEKLMVVKNGKIEVPGMWRMQLLGELLRGLKAHHYDDYTNWEYYHEVMWQIDSAEQRDEFRREHLNPDTYDRYFEDLAEVAAKIGCERAEIKCLIKAQILRYNHVWDIEDFPNWDFSIIYQRLISSKDLEQLRAAERLSRYHIKQFEKFLNWKTKERIFRLEQADASLS